jgi:hypothetical protein
MQNNKLIKLLASFDRKEMTRFRAFVCSPYHNKHGDVQQLVAYLCDIFPDFSARHCHREVIFQHLFPAAAHNQKKLAIIFTYTLRLAQKFLGQEQFEQAPHYQEHFLLQHLRIKQQLSLYEKRLRKNETLATQVAVKKPSWYFHCYTLATEADNFFKLAEERKRDDSLQRKQAFLDLFYLVETLKDACEMAVRSQILKESYHNPLQEPIIKAVEQHFSIYNSEPLIAIYFRIYKMISSEDTQYYYNTLSTLAQINQVLPLEELKTAYNYLQNYCIQKINKGDASFLAEIFKLYKIQLQQELLLKEGFLSEWQYKNIVTTGIRLGELKWVHQFIQDYHLKLPPESRDNAYRFNLAAYYYAAGELDEVLKLLTQVEYSDLRYNLDAKALLLRTYYDLDEYEALNSLAESFKQYLFRNKLMADNRRKGYQNLFKFTRRAASIRNNLAYVSTERSIKEIKRLQEEINTVAAIFNKGWLEEKVAGIQQYLDGKRG